MKREKFEVEREKFQWTKTVDEITGVKMKEKNYLLLQSFQIILKNESCMVFKSMLIQKEWDKNCGKVVSVFTFSKAWPPVLWPKWLM